MNLEQAVLRHAKQADDRPMSLNPDAVAKECGATRDEAQATLISMAVSKSIRLCIWDRVNKVLLDFDADLIARTRFYSLDPYVRVALPGSVAAAFKF